MRRFLIVPLCLATLLWGIVGANAAITYTTVGSSTSTGTSLAINPSANIPAGSLIVVGIFNRGASSGSISDTKGNSYVLGANGANGPSPSGYGAVYYVYNSVALTTSDTITFTSTNSGISMTLGYATGIMTASDPKDFSPAVTSSSAGTSQSVTGSAATVAGELNVCIAGGFNGAGARTLSRPGSPWSVGNDIVNYSVSSAF